MVIVQVPRRFVASDWGGTETVVLETCKRLRHLGQETEIVCPMALADQCEDVIGGIPVTRVPYFYPYWGLGPAARQALDKKGGNMFSFALMKSLRQRPDLDLIHLHTLKRVGGIGRHVARTRRIPYVVTLHGGVYDVPAEEASSLTAPTDGALEWGKVLGLWVGSRRVLGDAAAILCVGLDEQKQVQERFPSKRVIHLPNGVDPDRFAEGDGLRFRGKYGIAQGARVVLTVGRIDPQKNQMLAVRCLPDLLRNDPNVHLVFIGHVTNDGYRETLEAESQRLDIEKNVTLIPGLAADGSDLVDAYHGADLFLLPSAHEPFGIVILEAWASGLPVVASRVGGVRSLVGDGVDGVLFDPSNAGQLVEAVTSLIGDPERARSVAQAGCAKARDRYSWDTVTRDLLKVYEEVIRESPLRQ